MYQDTLPFYTSFKTARTLSDRSRTKGTVTHRLAKRSTPGRTVMETLRNGYSALWFAVINRDKTDHKVTKLERNFRYQGIHMLPITPRSTSKFSYGLLRTGTFYSVNLVFTTAYYVSQPHRGCRGKACDSLKFWPGITAITVCRVCLSCSPALYYVHPVFSTVFRTVIALAAGNTVWT